jgi:hypothetical protein
MLKIERATEHLDEVRDFIRDERSLDAAFVRHEDDPATGERLIVLREVSQPPARIAVLTGDFFHCCRSALDHLAWQLVKHPAVRSGDTASDTQINFPIFLRRERYSDRAIHGSTPHARELVAQIQPFHAIDPSQHPLWILHQLWNWDKHRVLHTANNTLIEAGIASGAENLTNVRFAQPGPIAENTELVRYEAPQCPDAQAQFWFGLDVTFADGPAHGMKVESLMTTVFDTVIDVVIRLFSELDVDGSTIGPPGVQCFLRANAVLRARS